MNGAETKLETRTAKRAVGYDERCVMLFRDVLGNRQPKPSPTIAGLARFVETREALEDLSTPFAGDARTIIINPETCLSTNRRPDSDLDL